MFSPRVFLWEIGFILWTMFNVSRHFQQCSPRECSFEKTVSLSLSTMFKPAVHICLSKTQVIVLVHLSHLWYLFDICLIFVWYFRDIFVIFLWIWLKSLYWCTWQWHLFHYFRIESRIYMYRRRLFLTRHCALLWHLVFVLYLFVICLIFVWILFDICLIGEDWF